MECGTGTGVCVRGMFRLGPLRKSAGRLLSAGDRGRLEPARGVGMQQGTEHYRGALG